MYSKIYRQLFTSSVMEEDLITRYVWLCMIALADKEGIVDMTRESLARTLNMPLDQLNKSIERLLSPDITSRSSKSDGRRLTPLTSDRNWGWLLVNYTAYRDIKNEDDRREYMKNYMKMRRSLTSSNSMLNDVNNVSHSDPTTPAAPAPASERQPSATSTKRLSDPEFLEAIKNNPAYSHINLSSELGKMDAWLLTHPGRKKTRQFIVNWLNKNDSPMEKEKTLDRYQARVPVV